jgi:hypothetical protein
MYTYCINAILTLFKIYAHLSDAEMFWAMKGPDTKQKEKKLIHNNLETPFNAMGFTC